MKACWWYSFTYSITCLMENARFVVDRPSIKSACSTLGSGQKSEKHHCNNTLEKNLPGAERRVILLGLEPSFLKLFLFYISRITPVGQFFGKIYESYITLKSI